MPTVKNKTRQCGGREKTDLGVIRRLGLNPGSEILGSSLKLCGHPFPHV